MNILIIENEKPAADKIQSLLKKIDPLINILGITETVEDSVNWLQTNKNPDLILIDIQLDDGISFEIFDTIDIDIPVIFTTAYDAYVLQAFKVNSVDYLLKPIDEKSLRTALEKFKTVHQKLNQDLIRQFIDGLKTAYKNRFLIKIGSHFKSISVQDIICFYIVERAVMLRTIDGKEYALDDSLDQIEKMVNPDQFFRVNRHFIISIDAISYIDSYSSSRLQIRMDLNQKNLDKGLMIVSRDKVRLFKKWIDR